MASFLDQLDRERIAAAVEDAEARTAGEIVPVIVPQSGDYDVAVWRGASILALASLLVLLGITEFTDTWGYGWLYTPTNLGIAVVLSGTVGALLGAYVPPVIRQLTGPDRLDEAVHRRAMQAFVEEEVFLTRDRTGILLFVSVLEHRIEVLGDTGIHQQVDPDDWAGIVERVREGIKAKALTEGIVDAIGMCGRLLERKGVNIRPDDEDELPNEIRTPGYDPDDDES